MYMDEYCCIATCYITEEFIGCFHITTRNRQQTVAHPQHSKTIPGKNQILNYDILSFKKPTGDTIQNSLNRDWFFVPIFQQQSSACSS